MKQAVAAEVAKATPPGIVSAISANEWVSYATFAYIILQAAYLVWKWYKEAKTK